MVNYFGGALIFSSIFTSFFEFLSIVAIVSHTITIPSIAFPAFDFFAATPVTVHLVLFSSFSFFLSRPQLWIFSAMSNTAEIPNKAMTILGKLIIVFSLFCL